MGKRSACHHEFIASDRIPISTSSASRFSSVMSHLQFVFASMTHSLNSVVSVQPLVEFLGIDPKVQQDFEEFSSLLRSELK